MWKAEVARSMQVARMTAEWKVAYGKGTATLMTVLRMQEVRPQMNQGVLILENIPEGMTASRGGCTPANACSSVIAQRWDTLSYI